MMVGEGVGGREREKISIMGREIFLKKHFMGPVKGILVSLSQTPGACAKKMFKCLSLNQKDYINEDRVTIFIRMRVRSVQTDCSVHHVASYLEGTGGSFLGVKGARAGR
jgi:hypothetical protein